MNHQVRNSNVSANPTNETSDDLLRELAKETGMARRQELLKALWRLDRHRAQPVSQQSTRPRAAAAATPETQLRNPLSVQEPNRRPNARTKSQIARATRQSDYNRSPEIKNEQQTLAVLNRLYAIEQFSLANYLRYAKPWVAAADQCLADAIQLIGDQQREFAERVGSLLYERRGHVEGGSFPFRFTAYNDLSVAYLAPRVMEDQERIVRQVTEIARQLRADAVACDLANEILGAEKAHLDNLRELLDRQKGEPRRKSAVTGPSAQPCQDDAPNAAMAA